MTTDSPRLRSTEWFDTPELYGWLRKAAFMAQGYGPEAYENRPIIGICNSWSELTHCNSHLRQLAEAVKRGVWQAGGFPMEFPVMSLGEYNMRPTTMLFRNLMSMEVEESLRANPLDGVVLLGGCDKTTPALLMGAASADIPAIIVTGGPQLKANWRGEELGSCTDCRRYEVELRAGNITGEDWAELQTCIVRSPGHCMVMGTASTMASMAEAMGMALPGNAAIPAVDSRRHRLSELAGRQIVNLVEQDIRPSQIMTREAFENAIRTMHALGGSTNAVIHLTAIAGRLGIDLPGSLFDELSRTTPFILNLKPSGQYLMEDFFYAGGLAALLKEIQPLLHDDRLTVTGQTLAENIAPAINYNPDVIRSMDEPMDPEGGLAVLTRLPRPDRRADKAHRRLRVPDDTRGTRHSVRGPRRPVRPHRRPGPGRHPGRCSGDARQWADRRARYAGMGIPAPAQEDTRHRRPRHGAPQRRAHERHRLRHRGCPRDPRIRRRGAACRRPKRRPYQPERPRTPPGPPGRGEGNPAPS